MATYTLDEAECEAIYLALRGDANESTLLKTKKMLETQRLPHAVQEVQAQLLLLQGSGVDSPGLLRMFNPQHDLLADSTASDAAAKVAKADKDTLDMFGTTKATEGVDDSPQDEPEAVPGIAWGDDVPQPRPQPGELVVQPSGMSASIGDVLGYDPERAAFRVVDVDGWDGFVFRYGLRDAGQWRLLGQALEYADGSDFATQGQGSRLAIARELATLAHELAAGDATYTDRTAYDAMAGRVLSLLVGVGTELQPEYLRDTVAELFTEYPDENAHALATLALQYADVALAAEEAAATGEQPADALHAAMHEGQHEGEQAVGTTDDLTPDPFADMDDDDTADGTEAGTLGDTQDAFSEQHEGDAERARQDEQALAEGSYESEPARTDEQHDADMQNDGPAQQHPTPGARTVGKVGKQRERNATQAGLRKPVTKKGTGKSTGKKGSGKK